MSFSVKVDPSTWQRYISVPVKGKAILMDPFTNKGTARLDILKVEPS